MLTSVLDPQTIDMYSLRLAIQEEYERVALEPESGFHFHTGRPLARLLGYLDEWLAGIPEASIESFAGTGNPFSLGALGPGDKVVDVGSGAGIDSLIAARMVSSATRMVSSATRMVSSATRMVSSATRMVSSATRMVAPTGQVIGVDMTPAMIAKARRAAEESGIDNVEFRPGYAETLPVEDGWADVVISNGVLNLVPDKSAALQEMARVLKPGGRLQIGDILVQKAVSESAKQKIDLWAG
jgi:SAM-dependent methyltransferase